MTIGQIVVIFRMITLVQPCLEVYLNTCENLHIRTISNNSGSSGSFGSGIVITNSSLERNVSCDTIHASFTWDYAETNFGEILLAFDYKYI